LIPEKAQPMNRSVWLVATLSLCTFPWWVRAQLQAPWHNENHAGINGVLLNPAASTYFPLKWDFNVAEGSLFVENDLAYLERTNLLELYSSRHQLNFAFRGDTEKPPNPGDVIFDFSREEIKRISTVQMQILGPSLLLNLTDRHSVGLFTRARAAWSAWPIPAPFNYYPYDARPFFDTFEVNPFQTSFMSWSEWGMSYCYRFSGELTRTGIALSLKKLLGYEAGFFEVEEPFLFQKLPNDSIAGEVPQLRFGFTRAAIDSFPDIVLTKNGGGMGIDLGVVIVVNPSDDRDSKPYDYRLGVSIFDLGGIRFRKNAALHRMAATTRIALGGDDFQGLDRLEDYDTLIRTFSRITLGTPGATYQGAAFTMHLPTAISLQADYCFHKNLFVNATLVQEVPIFRVAPYRGSYFALTPRMEHRWFAASLPIVLYRWRDVRIGASIRLGYLVLGTENLGSFLGNGGLTGTDFYAALKINPFPLSVAGYDIKFKRKRGKVKCYEF
jgi:hypothetical protein